MADAYEGARLQIEQDNAIIADLRRQLVEAQNRPRSANRELMEQHAEDTQENTKLLIENLRLRHALERYHALMANVHGVTQNPVGSAAWNAWMLERDKAQIEAQRALAALDQPPTEDV